MGWNKRSYPGRRLSHHCWPLWCLCILATGLGHELLAQSPLDQPVTLQVNDVSLEQALYQLIESEGVRISFRNDQLPARRVSLNMRARPLRQVLDELLADTPLEYRLLGRQIVLSPRREPPPPKFFTLSGFISTGVDHDVMLCARDFR